MTHFTQNNKCKPLGDAIGSTKSSGFISDEWESLYTSFVIIFWYCHSSVCQQASNKPVYSLRWWTCRGLRCCRRHCQTVRWSCWTTVVTLWCWSDPERLHSWSWTSCLCRQATVKIRNFPEENFWTMTTGSQIFLKFLHVQFAACRRRQSLF